MLKYIWMTPILLLLPMVARSRGSVWSDFPVYNAMFAAPNAIQVSFPRGIVSYEKFFSLCRARGFSYLPMEKVPQSSGTVLLLGVKASRLKTGSGTRAVELFHNGPPITAGHGIIPFSVQASSWCKLFRQLKPKSPKLSPIALLSTPALQTQSRRMLEECKITGLTTTVQIMKSEDVALAFIGKLFKAKRPPWGIHLAHDIETLSPKVLELALRLQYRRGILIFVRTKHEVLAGGIAAWEPLMTPEGVESWLQNGAAEFSEHLYYNPLVARALEIHDRQFVSLGGKPKSW
ncbi:hypothetical protein KKF84_18325 [Myxococcota bacterium]|nr:hypothetical protein [Myxococcota bacterium]MBU1537280.1 hypothetical protein [Myxococcota bacterium]